MADNNHPITPSRELIQQWLDETDGVLGDYVQAFSTKAAQWGANQELDACISWIRERPCTWTAEQLRAARRPKPKSLAEEALEEVGAFEGMGTCNIDIIRRALGRLQELEGKE